MLNQLSGKLIISIHPPRGGRDVSVPFVPAILGISIHPPRGGRDEKIGLPAFNLTNFNPPSPWGEGRLVLCEKDMSRIISIHPPRGGRDSLTHL